MAAEHVERLGRRIAELREARGLTQRQLAELLPGRTDSGQVSKWERGVNRPSDTTLDHIAKALGTTVFELMGPAPVAARPSLPQILGEGAPQTQLDRIEAKLDRLLGVLGAATPLGAAEQLADEALAELAAPTAPARPAAARQARKSG